MIWQTLSTGSGETERLGKILGERLDGHETIELEADLGGGKTTFTKGLAAGLGVTEKITSPTFVVSRKYKSGKNIELRHYDFYRLDQAGIMAVELHESIEAPDVVTVIEWAKTVEHVLPKNHLKIRLEAASNNLDERKISIIYPEKFSRLIYTLETEWSISKP